MTTQHNGKTAPYSLHDAYSAILGEVGAISPELYALALGKMAEMTGRVNDAAFRTEIVAHSKTLPCPID